MFAERSSGAAGGRGGNASGESRRPRVVFLDSGDGPHVEVLELPSSVGPGQQFRHRGASYRITGTRASQRVLIAEPFDH